MYKISANIICNNEKYWIKESILSIVNIVDDIIYIDDRSTDGSLEIVEGLSNIYKNIKIFKYKDHGLKKLGELKNFALLNSKNELVIRWDADFIAYNDITELFRFSLSNIDKYDAYILKGPNLQGDIYHSPINNESFGPEVYLFKKSKMTFKETNRYSDYPVLSGKINYCYPNKTILSKDFFFIHMNRLKSLKKIAYRKRMSEYQISNYNGSYWTWLSNKTNESETITNEINRVKNEEMELIDFDFNKWGSHPEIIIKSESVNLFKIKNISKNKFIIDYHPES